MCMVNVNVDEAELRELRPELNNMSAISLWVQGMVNLRMQQMRMERYQNASQEDLWHAIEQDPELTLKPSVIVEDDGEAIDLEIFRADLHRMVEEIYAET